MNDLTLLLLIANAFIMGIGIAYLCLKRYHLAVFLMALSPGLSTVFISTNAEGVEEAGIGSYMRIALIMLIGAAGLAYFVQTKLIRLNQIPSLYKLFGLFLLLALASTSYSLDPRYTFVRSASFVGVFAFLVGLYSWLQNRQRWAQALHALFLMVALGTMLSLVFMKVLPERAWNEAVDGRFQGFWSHPNTMGSFCTLSYPVLLWKYSKGGLATKLMIIVLGLTLFGLQLLTGSRGSLVGAVLGIGTWLVVLRKNVKLLLMLTAVGSAGLLIMQMKPASFKRAGEYANATDLSGREEFWAACYQIIQEKPLFGYGYAVEGKVWSDPRFHKPGYILWSGSARTSLHNGYLSVIVGVGMLGFAIWSIILFVPYWQSWRLPRGDHKAFVLAIMSICLVVNFIETEIASGNSYASMLFWIAWAMAVTLLHDSQSGHGSDEAKVS